MKHKLVGVQEKTNLVGGSVIPSRKNVRTFRVKPFISNRIVGVIFMFKGIFSNHGRRTHMCHPTGCLPTKRM
jgi:hypothetical protein